LFNLKSAIKECEKRCIDASSSFVASFSTLPTEKKNAVSVVYAMCRWIDDIADGDSLESLNVDDYVETFSRNRLAKLIEIKEIKPSGEIKSTFRKFTALNAIRLRIRAFSDGEETASNEHPVMVAMHWVINNFSVRLIDLETIIDGMEDDLFPTKMQTWDEVRGYCYKVASAVGLVLIEIYGYNDSKARYHAIDMGIQMQLINILRDVKEDLERGRIYLPISVLKEHGINEDALSDPNLESEYAWSSFTQHYVNVVHEHQTSAKELLPLLHPNSRMQPEIMFRAYESLLSHINKTRGAVFSKRPKVRIGTKVTLAWKIISKRALNLLMLN
jgi:phytoene synthase